MKRPVIPIVLFLLVAGGGDGYGQGSDPKRNSLGQTASAAEAKYRQEVEAAGELVNPLYLGIGEADEVQSIAMHQPFLDAVAGLDHVDVTTYPGADHGYTWPGYPTYDEAAAETSWTKTLAMFDDALR